MSSRDTDTQADCYHTLFLPSIACVVLCNAVHCSISAYAVQRTRKQRPALVTASAFMLRNVFRKQLYLVSSMLDGSAQWMVLWPPSVPFQTRGSHRQSSSVVCAAFSGRAIGPDLLGSRYFRLKERRADQGSIDLNALRST